MSIFRVVFATKFSMHRNELETKAAQNAPSIAVKSATVSCKKIISALQGAKKTMTLSLICQKRHLIAFRTLSLSVSYAVKCFPQKNFKIIYKT